MIKNFLYKNFIYFYSFIFSRKFFIKFNNLIFKCSLSSLGIQNLNSRSEFTYIKKIIKNFDFNNNLFLDIGAHHGEITEYVYNLTNNIDIVSFEPNPNSFNFLKNRFKNKLDRIDLQNIACGNKDENSVIYDFENSKNGSVNSTMIKDVMTELYKRKKNTQSIIELKIVVSKLDSFLKDNKKKIPIIKIDTEGFEYNIIEGALETFKNASVEIVIIEFNKMNVYKKVFLRDFCNILKNYNPYRLMANGDLLNLYPYNPVNSEIFGYQNIVFKKHNLKC